MFAIVRPDEWNLPLFVHVLGAFALIGVLFMAALLLFAGRGRLDAARSGFKTLLYAGLPAYIVMRVGAQWIASEEDLADSEATWITMGYISTEGGLLLMIGATVAAGLGVRRAGRDGAEVVSGRGVSAAAWIVGFLLLLYVVMLWVMASKPA